MPNGLGTEGTGRKKLARRRTRKKKRRKKTRIWDVFGKFQKLSGAGKNMLLYLLEKLWPEDQLVLNGPAHCCKA